MLLSLLALDTATTTVSPLPRSSSIAYVDVAVTTLWTDPSMPRPVDTPAISNPIHIEQWLHAAISVTLVISLSFLPIAT